MLVGGGVEDFFLVEEEPNRVAGVLVQVNAFVDFEGAVFVLLVSLFKVVDQAFPAQVVVGLQVDLTLLGLLTCPHIC